MSVIVTRVNHDTIQIGADSAMTTNTNLQFTDETAKLIHVDDLVIGFTGNVESLSVLRYTLENIKEEITIETRNDVIDLYHAYTQVAAQFDVQLRGSDETGLNGPSDAMHLIGCGKAWYVQGYYVKEITDSHVIGSGGDFAMGALHVGAGIEESIDAACKYDAGCKRPVIIYTVPKDGVGITYKRYE